MPPSELRRRVRSVLTVTAVLAVVFGEFVLLTAVYRRPLDLHRERVTQAQLVGTLWAVHTPTAPVVAEVASSVAELRAQGVAAKDLGPLDAAVRNLAAHPASVSALDGVRTRDSQLGGELAKRQRDIDDEAETIYVVLLALASVGWFGWFRRVVRKQRALQHTLTEQTAHAESETRLASLVRSASDVIAVVDPEATIGYVTPSSEPVLGAPPEDLVGSRFTDLLHPDDIDHFMQVLTTTSPGTEQPLTVRVRRSRSEVIYVEGVVRNLLEESAVGGLVVTVRDITERRMLEQQLTHQALHDALTGLANRRLFADRLAHALERRGERMQPLAVLFVDLDDFKTVNDSLGHVAGDEVLAEIGARIGSLLRAGDTIARVGGDEFAVLLEDAGVEAAENAADRLIEAIAAPIVLAAVTVQISASIGITMAIPGEVSAEEALRNSDLAMYWAKERGKATTAVYESRLHTEALERLQLRADLQQALRGDELVLYYQPEVDLHTGRIVAAEALVRWQHPTRGLLAPASFVPMAEESRLITSLDRWVLSTACTSAAALQSEGYDVMMSVNLSVASLERVDLVSSVTEAVQASGVKPGRLILEITESAVLGDFETVAPKLVALRELGVRIAIDDFGTGYSSLAYLSHLDVDVLKIDKTFVDRVTQDPQAAAVTEAIIAIGKGLDLQTVAEGVEDVGQVNWLRAAGCAVGQGYVWACPFPLDELRETLRDGLRLAAPAPEGDAVRTWQSA
ncbi:MAG TPA: EAL domain-containing protein [Mycobacteriales bacterium]|nr:EAL domain-containing protein [Mycobacteriales bacterium]